MKKDEFNLTVDELDELCSLYMDCKLSVLEEKELEYVLSRTSMTSPTIEEVRSIMKIPALDRGFIRHRKSTFRIWKFISGIAASLAVIVTAAYYFISLQSPNVSDYDSSFYVSAYSHGERLNRNEAVLATNIAIVKADSLMRLASLTERENMLKANDIINETLNN